jgi:hypothetical protein
MLEFVRAGAEVSRWIDGAVIVRLGPGTGVSRFPAMPHAMLTMRLARSASRSKLSAALCPPVTFHTLTTGPVAYVHEGGITALGLLVRPEAAACLLGEASGAIVDQVLPWSVLAGAPEASRLEEGIDRSGNDNARIDASIKPIRDCAPHWAVTVPWREMNWASAAGRSSGAVMRFWV